MGGVRLLRESDRDAILRLCARHPVDNLFVASRVTLYGVERRRLGCDVLGYVDEFDTLVSVLHCGANLVPVEMTDEAREAFVAYLGVPRPVSSIMGPADAVMPLFRDLAAQSSAWSSPRDVRAAQPLLVLDRDPDVAPDPRVRVIDRADFSSYYDASVRMYTEEVGVSPVGPDNSYADHVRRAIRERRAYGIVENGRVVYKSDVGASLGQICQIQGVWLDPDLRGRRMAPAAMAGVAAQVAEKTPVISLYVNDYNTPALATYRKVGFQRVGTFATILY